MARRSTTASARRGLGLGRSAANGRARPARRRYTLARDTFRAAQAPAVRPGVVASETTAAFDAPYADADALVHGRSTARDPRTTMLPFPRATIPGTSARSDACAVSRFVAIIARRGN